MRRCVDGTLSHRRRIVNARQRNKPRRPRGRGRWLLSKLRDFISEKGWLPTAVELTAYVRRGSRWTTWRDLRALGNNGLVRMEHRRWAIARDGFEFLGMTPITARFPSRPKPKSLKQRNAEARAAKPRRQLDIFEVFERRHLERAPWIAPERACAVALVEIID